MAAGARDLRRVRRTLRVLPALLVVLALTVASSPHVASWSLPSRLFPRLGFRVGHSRAEAPAEPARTSGVSASAAEEAAVDRFLAAGVPAAEVQGMAELSLALGAAKTEPLADPLTLLRFYRARHANVNAAAHMWRETLAWRASFSIPAIMDAFGSPGEYRPDGRRATDVGTWSWRPCPRTPEAQLADRHAFFGRLPGCEAEELVLIWRAGSADFEGMVREGLVDLMVQAFVAHLEDAFQTLRARSLQSKKLQRAQVIIDCEGFSFENIRYVPILRRIIAMATSYFPEISASVTVIRAPSCLAGLYALVRPMLPTVLQKKTCILGDGFEKGLYKRTGLHPDAWPDFLGGQGGDCGMGQVLPVPGNAWDLLQSQGVAYA